MLESDRSSRFDQEKLEETRFAGPYSQISRISREESHGVSIETHVRHQCHSILCHPASEPMTSKLLFSVALGLGLFLAVSGCNSSESETTETATPAADANSPDHSEMEHDHAGHDHGDHDHGDGDHAGKTDMETMTEALTDFSEEDRKSAMKQHFCPVSGEMLGTMGEPEKVEIQGQQVWICCDGCKDKLLVDPDKYLAKLND
jgi:Cu(I)/Ag(I) efflux system membrane fusion protein